MDTKPDSYYRSVRDEVLGYLPDHPHTVLDVGCGEGAFGYQVKQGRGSEVWGIELADDPARIAAGRLDQVLCGDVAALLDQLPPAYFDAVVFNDILEHLVDPYDVLARIKRCIRPGGVVVSSIPNIRYYPTLFDLVVRKSWEYEESGILDRTHLRFFTVRSILAMYERLGYDVLRHEGINPMPREPRHFRLANWLLRGRISDMRFIQFVTVARPRQLAEDPARSGSQAPSEGA